MPQYNKPCPNCDTEDPFIELTGDGWDMECCGEFYPAEGDVAGVDAHVSDDPTEPGEDTVPTPGELDEDELVTELINSYEGQEWERLAMVALEADHRGVDRGLGFVPQVESLEDRLDRALVHVKAAKRDLEPGEGPRDQVLASCRLLKHSKRLLNGEEQ